MTFICFWAIRTNKIYTIRDKKSNQWSSVCYRNMSQMYYSYNSNIKYLDLTIKYIDFESFYYVINLNVVLFFVVFSDFDYKFPSMY